MPSLNSFIERQLRVTFIMTGNQVFPGTNSNRLVLTNLRMTAQVQTVARQAPTAALRIFGMTMADMNALSIAWALAPVVLRNIVQVEARSQDGTRAPNEGWSQVFVGTIKEAQPMYRAAPNVSFDVLGVIGYEQKINPVPPTAYEETTDIGLVAGDLAEKMGFQFENGGVDTVLDGPLYLCGTYYDQLATACRKAKADFYFLGERLVVVPAGAPFAQRPAVILNKGSGLIGYPQYTAAGLEVQAIYDPAFQCATPVEIQSIVPGAVGRWNPYGMTHTLESRTPNGEWSTKMNCIRVPT